MEFDILNQLLTSTVYTLFSNKPQESSIDNKKRVRQLQKFFKPESVINIRKNDQSMLSGVSGGSQANLQRQIPPCQSIQVWMTTESARRLKESMQRLDITLDTLRQRAELDKHLDAQSLDVLVNLKKKVKNQLKIYDNDFTVLFKRPPTRAQKQPFRPLYGYYKKLKQSIDKKGGKQDIEKRIQTIKEQRRQLRQKIQNYQASFQRNHNRKIRYVRDIQPIEAQYRRYKQLKVQLLRLQDALGNQI